MLLPRSNMRGKVVQAVAVSDAEQQTILNLEYLEVGTAVLVALTAHSIAEDNSIATTEARVLNAVITGSALLGLVAAQFGSSSIGADPMVIDFVPSGTYGLDISFTNPSATLIQTGYAVWSAVFTPQA